MTEVAIKCAGSQQLEESIVLLWNAELAMSPGTSADLRALVLTHSPVWGPEDNAWGLIMAIGQIKCLFPKCHTPQMEATSDKEAGKQPCPSEGDLSTLA